MILLVLYLAAIGALHIAAMITFERLSLGDAAWLTMTTVTTVGYGDISAASAAGRAGPLPAGFRAAMLPTNSAHARLRLPKVCPLYWCGARMSGAGGT